MQHGEKKNEGKELGRSYESRLATTDERERLEKRKQKKGYEEKPS